MHRPEIHTSHVLVFDWSNQKVPNEMLLVIGSLLFVFINAGDVKFMLQVKTANSHSLFL